MHFEKSQSHTPILVAADTQHAVANFLLALQELASRHVGVLAEIFIKVASNQGAFGGVDHHFQNVQLANRASD